jgi:hypothetical protein
MIILFEEYQYKTEKLKQVLSERYFFPINSVYSKINYVGYYFNPIINNAVIIFPKVFINENGFAFDEFEPENLIIPSNEIKEKLSKLEKTKLFLKFQLGFTEQFNNSINAIFIIQFLKINF